MKSILGSILLLSSVMAHALEVKVHKMSPVQYMERSFVLHTKSIPEKMVLDCQSFVQGLTVGEGQSEAFFFLDPQECEDLYLRTNQSLKKRQKHCLELGDVIHADYSCS